MKLFVEIALVMNALLGLAVLSVRIFWPEAWPVVKSLIVQLLGCGRAGERG